MESGTAKSSGVTQEALGYPTPIVATIQARTALDVSNSKNTTASKVSNVNRSRLRVLAVNNPQLQYIFLVISVPTLGAIKASVLLFYRRIFVVDKSDMKSLNNLLYLCTLVIVCLWTTGFTFSFMFACKGNFTAWWTSAVSLITNCVNTLELLFAFGVSDFILDCIILLVPIPMVISLSFHENNF
jgi:Na+/melibiose symporter-like transporter